VVAPGEADPPAVDELPDDAIVLRAGQDNRIDHFHTSMEDHAITREEDGLDPEYCLSVNCVPGLTHEELALLANHPHPAIRFTTVAEIRRAGFVIEKSENWDARGHCDVYSQYGRSHQPTGIELYSFQRVLSDPMGNPTSKG
jgi:hypothetical protein